MKQLILGLAAVLSLAATADTECPAKTLASGEKDGMRFSIVADAAALRVEVAFDEPKAGQKDEPQNEIEVFFQSTDLGVKYYQFYGSPRDGTVEPYYWAKFRYDYNRFADFTVENALTEGKGRKTVIVLPWHEFRYRLPKAGDTWRFTVARTREGSATTVWKGAPHEPKTWDAFAFPEDPARDAAIAALGGKIAEAKRRHDTKVFYADADTLRGQKWTLDADEDGEFWLVNLCVGGRTDADVRWTVSVDGKAAETGALAALPRHVRLGRLAKGATVEVAFVGADGKPARVNAGYALVALKDGRKPGAAYDVRRLPIDVASPKRESDGEPKWGELERAKLRTDRVAHEVAAGRPPRVFFLGDSITQGLEGKPWERLAKWRPANLGVSGDWIQNVLWRIDLGMFEKCRPEALVLMIGTNNGGFSADEIVRGIEAILKRIRTLSPKTKILVYGILPRGKTWPKDGTAPTVNARLAKLADGKTLFFRDIAASYLKEDGVTVRGELFRDGLHPNEAGNDKWVDSILPALDEILR